jgi:hypothetical protein
MTPIGIGMIAKESQAGAAVPHEFHCHEQPVSGTTDFMILTLGGLRSLLSKPE